MTSTAAFVSNCSQILFTTHSLITRHNDNDPINLLKAEQMENTEKEYKK